MRAAQASGGKMRARKNLKVDPRLKLDKAQLDKGVQAYTNWHWGLTPTQVSDWKDPDMPPVLIECGRLVRVHVRVPRQGVSKNPRHQRDTMIQFAKSVSDHSHVAYDPSHSDERLYLLVARQALPTLKKRFWDGNNLQAMELNQLASVAGGKHGKRADYPMITVKPIGVLTALVYYTSKAGDSPPPSYYIHQMAEISGWYPILAVDNSGRLWLAGGNYTVPTPGITD